MTEIVQEGRRYYLDKLPFEAKDRAKSLGCKFDWDSKRWWTGKKDVALKVAEKVNGSSSDAAPDSERNDRPAPGEDQIVAGKAKYKGRTYYVAGRVEKGRTHWDDRVSTITTRDGTKILLCFRDGSKSFWAPRSEAPMVKYYEKPKTIGSLQRFAAKAKTEGFSGGGEYCYHMCPVGNFKCCPENGPCHDCE